MSHGKVLACVLYGIVCSGLAGCTISLIQLDSKGPMAYPATCGVDASVLTLHQAAYRDIPIFDTGYPRGEGVWAAKRWCTNPNRYRIADVRFIRASGTSGEIAMGVTGADGTTRYVRWAEVGSEVSRAELVVVARWNPSAGEVYRIILERSKYH